MDFELDLDLIPKPVLLSGILGTCIVLVILLQLVLRLNNRSQKTATSHGVGNRGTLYRRLRYLFDGPAILRHKYEEANGLPFVVNTPSNNHVLLSSEEHINELTHAPHEQLSLHAVAKELLQPKHTMRGFEWQDKRGVEGTGFVRALRSLLTSHLPVLLPRLHNTIDQGIQEALKSSLSKSAATSTANVFPLMKELVVRVNCTMFFGEELSQNDELRAAALQFPQDVVMAGEMLRLTPEFLKPAVGYLATRGHWATSTLSRILEPVVKARLDARSREQEDGVEGSDKPVDCMQWLIDTSPRKNPWTSTRMIGEIMGIWFGSVHQLAMAATYMIHDLCNHPEYADLLRAELSQLNSNDMNDVVSLQRLELMESFITESSRMSCFDAVSGRRKALRDYTFADGTQVRRGDWICLPQIAIMNDAHNFSEPDKFNGFRFASPSAIERVEAVAIANATSKPDIGIDVGKCTPMRFTDVNTKWLIWGIGNTACPGRFYSSAVLKLILSHVLLNYDVREVDPTARKSMVWRSSIVPLESAKVDFTRR